MGQRLIHKTGERKMQKQPDTRCWGREKKEGGRGLNFRIPKVGGGGGSKTDGKGRIRWTICKERGVCTPPNLLKIAMEEQGYNREKKGTGHARESNQIRGRRTVCS